jgi:hypothetical protein
MEMNPTAAYSLERSINVAATGNGTDVWGNAGFVPIGNASTAFTGTFDGQSQTLSNLTINQPTATDVGLFGHIGSSATVQNVGLVNGAVTGSRNVGALVGFNDDIAVVSNSYATGKVSGAFNVGGLVGENEAVITDSYAGNSVSGSNNVGGLIGWNGGGSVIDTYAGGRVFGTSSVGGLLGYNNNGGTVGGSFWDVTTTGQTKSAGGTGMTTAQMQTEANFTSATAANGNVNPAWDFTDTWFMNGAHSYPLLISFSTTP